MRGINRDLVQVLLLNGANVNIGGECFAIVATQDDLNILSDLLAHDSDISLVTPVLIRAISDEEKVVRYLERCFKAGGSGHIVQDGSVLLLVMEHFY